MTRHALRSARHAAIAAVVVVGLSACSSDDDGAPATSTAPDTTTGVTTSSTSSSSSTTTTTVEPAATTTTLPERVLADDVEFIEVSARLGVGDDAVVVALAVDTETLGMLPAEDADTAPAWCTGSDESLVELDGPIPRYLVRIEDPAVDATLGRAERFELETGRVSVGGGPVPARFVLVVDGLVHRVLAGTMDLGESSFGGTFSGTTSDGLVIDGAFLCG